MIMILQALHDLYERLKDDPSYRIAPPGYSLQKITFKVVIRPDGQLYDIQDVRRETNGGRRPRPMLVPGGAKSSGSGLNPCFLWDNTGYLLGYKPDDPNPERSRRSFEAFRDRHIKIEREIDSPAFSAVCRFLESWQPEKATDFPVLAEIATGFGVFQIIGESSFVHQDPRVTDWWDRIGDAGSDMADQGQCLITGDSTKIAQIHPKIKGVTGAQSSGAVIVGFNEDAYESFGKKQSFNAPVGADAAFRYTTAVNALLDGPMAGKHRLSLGDTTVVFWTDRPSIVEDIFAEFAAEGSTPIESDAVQDESVREKLELLIKAIRSGRQVYHELDETPETTPFFLLGLAPNAARISIRFFHRSTVAELLDNLRAHFADIATEPQPAAGKRRGDPELPPAWLLLRQTAREAKEIPPMLAGPLLRAIVERTPYPVALVSAIIRRIRADRTVNYPRACAIKGFLTRNLHLEVSMSLDPDNPTPAYRLGRLFAALEKTQLDALGGNLSATVRDRFYSSASATPGVVFPRLLRTYQHHLAKLEGGRKVNREKLVQEILDPLGDFPARLDLAGQGLFALGYYHQMRSFFTKKTDDRAEASSSD